MKPTVAIIDQTNSIPFGTLEKVAKAIQIQVTENLYPHWGKDAIVTAYRFENDAPLGAWKVYIRNQITVNAYGHHNVDKITGLPFAELRALEVNPKNPSWSIVLSHEILEMLVNPYANLVLSGELFGNGEKVEILKEIADASQAENFGYEIDGVKVSDFYLPAFFDLTYTEGKQYSFTGAIKKPLEIVQGGYLSYQDRLGQWYSAYSTANGIVIKKLATGENLTIPEQKRLKRLLIVLGSLLVLGLITYLIL